MFKRIIEKGMISVMCGVLAFSQPLSIIAYAEEQVEESEEVVEVEVSEEDTNLNADTDNNIDTTTELIDDEFNNDVENIDVTTDEFIEEEDLENSDEKSYESVQVSEDSILSEENAEDYLPDKEESTEEIEKDSEVLSEDVVLIDSDEDTIKDDNIITIEEVMIGLECQNGQIDYKDYDEKKVIYVNNNAQIVINGGVSSSKSVKYLTLKFNLLIDSEDKVVNATLYKNGGKFTYDTKDLQIDRKEYEIYNINIAAYDKDDNEIKIELSDSNLIKTSTHISFTYKPDPFENNGTIYVADAQDLVDKKMNIVPGYGFWNIELANVDGYYKARLENQSYIGGDARFFVDEDGAQPNRKYLIWCKYSRWYFKSDFYREVIVDEVAPEVEFEVYNKDSNDIIKDVNDSYLAQKVYVKVKVNEYNIKSFKLYSKNGTLLKNETDLNKDKEGFYSLDICIEDDGEYFFSASCEDMLGRVTDAFPISFTIDTVAPKVSISFNNNNPKNGYYYNADRTATIYVEDKNFDTEDYTFNVNSRYGNSVSLGSWTQSGDVYTCNAVFKGDDEYSASFSCVDKAGNESDEIKIDRFVVDKTAPKLDYSYDNISAHKANYYNAARTAKVTISDMSFDSDLVAVDNNSDQNISISHWTGDNNSYTSEIACTADGRYQFYVYAEDLAGNKSEKMDCGTFIIDTIAPVIEISGVMDRSANAGSVIPTVNYKDLNLDNDNSIVTISGYKNGVLNPSDVSLIDGSGKNVTYNVFGFEKTSDDIYTVTAVAEDMAGNTAEISYMFSVNRFGSTFGVTQQTADLVGKFYTNAEQDLVLLETNVDNVDEQELYITKNGKNIKLVKDVDYFVEKEGTDATWKAYTYTVKKKNFVDEGTYEVSLFTKDRAGNQSDSNAQGMTIKFAVDKTAPSIVVAGIEDNTTYETEKLDINIDVQDNMGISYAEIVIDGNVVEKYAANDLKDLVTYSIKETDKPMTVVVRAVDLVGNLSEKKYEKVVISNLVKEEIVKVDDEMVPLVDTIDTEEVNEVESIPVDLSTAIENTMDKKVDLFFYATLSIVGMAVILGIIVIGFKRKNN